MTRYRFVYYITLPRLQIFVRFQFLTTPRWELFKSCACAENKLRAITPLPRRKFTANLLPLNVINK